MSEKPEKTTTLCQLKKKECQTTPMDNFQRALSDTFYFIEIFLAYHGRQFSMLLEP